eukprot:12938136-Prorocentrum_lima.AAC.1
MSDYARTLKPTVINTARRKGLQSDLTAAEIKELMRISGEISWLGRQCRMDMAFAAGDLQRWRAPPCVADL